MVSAVKFFSSVSVGVPVTSTPPSKFPLPVLRCTRYLSAPAYVFHDTSSSVVSVDTGSTDSPVRAASVVPETSPEESPLALSVVPMVTSAVTFTS